MLVTGLPVRPSYKFGFSAFFFGLPGGRRHDGLVPRNDVLSNGFIGFSLARILARILFVPRLRTPRNPEGVANLKKAICVLQSDSIIGVTIIFLLFEFKSVDDVGAGKLREMLTLHTNPHAVHGRFTLKDDCERQVWNAGAAS